MAAATIFCVWLGWCANRARVQLEAANKLATKGVSIGYGWRYPDFAIPVLDDSMHTKTLLWHFRCQGGAAVVGHPNYPADDRHVETIVPDLRRLPCLTTVYVNQWATDGAEAALRHALPHCIVIRE